MGFLIAVLAIGITFALLVMAYAWIARNAPSTPDSASPVINKFKKGLLIEDYPKNEERD